MGQGQERRGVKGVWPVVGMKQRFSCQSLQSAPLPPGRWLELREQLDSRPDAEGLARLAEAHAPLLTGLLRRAAGACPDPASRPVCAKEAVARLGCDLANHWLHTWLLLTPARQQPVEEERLLAIRRAAEGLVSQLAHERQGVDELDRTLLILLEWTPWLAVDPDSGPPPDSGLGQWLLEALGGSPGFHGDLVAALGAVADPGAQATAAGRRGALLRAAWQLAGARRAPAELDLGWAACLGLSGSRSPGERHG